MREDQVYVIAKRGLLTRGWKLLGGQPPRGTNHLPVIEIKSPARMAKGSRGAFKPDLVAWRPSGILLLVECKPTHDEADASKLRGVLGSPSRLGALWEEVQLRGLLGPDGPRREDVDFIGALAHAGADRPKMSDLGTIVCAAGPPSSISWRPATEWPPHVHASL